MNNPHKLPLLREIDPIVQLQFDDIQNIIYHQESSITTPIKTDDLAYSLANAMKSVGMGSNCNVPEPELFQLGTGQKINKFFQIFEKYCEYQYSNDKNDWIKVLGKYLQ